MNTSIAIPPAGEYVIDTEQSSVAFTTKHMFGLGTVRGTFALGGGRIQVADPVTRSVAEADVDAASFTTGTPARDNVVRSRQYLDTAHHPVFRFTGGRVRQASEVWLLEGDLTVRGVTRRVSLGLDRVEVHTGTFEARARTRIDRYEFGITTAKGMTGRHLDLVLTVLAYRA
ncbi:YceI family protein [Amycolatopsis anabasis]|uniref:YceI family protein n=1 Tax=Amycolatopsis anabasis TaxID=1840409 RepID=UPI001FE7530E|nr:YceI family protein [Amycolatopsis anabasis]